jgi:hypothetical protein
MNEILANRKMLWLHFNDPPDFLKKIMLYTLAKYILML